MTDCPFKGDTLCPEHIWLPPLLGSLHAAQVSLSSSQGQGAAVQESHGEVALDVFR